MIAVYTDVKEHKIYNLLTFPTLALGLFFSNFNNVGILNSFLGFLICFGIAFMFYLTKGIYGGDVKLMAAIGAWVGKSLALSNILYILVCGGLISIFYASIDGKLKPTMLKVGRFFIGWIIPGMNPQGELEKSINRYVPYGIAISLGTILSLLYPL